MIRFTIIQILILEPLADASSNPLLHSPLIHPSNNPDKSIINLLESSNPENNMDNFPFNPLNPQIPQSQTRQPSPLNPLLPYPFHCPLSESNLHLANIMPIFNKGESYGEIYCL